MKKIIVFIKNVHTAKTHGIGDKKIASYYVKQHQQPNKGNNKKGGCVIALPSFSELTVQPHVF